MSMATGINIELWLTITTLLGGALGWILSNFFKFPFWKTNRVLHKVNSLRQLNEIVDKLTEDNIKNSTTIVSLRKDISDLEIELHAKDTIIQANNKRMQQLEDTVTELKQQINTLISELNQLKNGKIKS